MTDRVDEEHASIEDIRLGIIEDLITRYLADQIDLRQLTDRVTISRLSEDWPTAYTGGWLRGLTAQHLFMFGRGTWPESTLRESLAFLLHEAIEGEGRWKTPMVDQQWLDLMAVGNVPPGTQFVTHTEESVLRMTPEERAQLRRELGLEG